jgi:hypothetical protein
VDIGVRIWRCRPLSPTLRTGVARLGETRATLEATAETTPSATLAALNVARLLGELETYVCARSGIIIDYATARRREEPISTTVTEITVQWRLHRRMNARQQMRWTPPGAHLMLKVRCAMMNGTFEHDHAVAKISACRPFGAQHDPVGLRRSHRVFDFDWASFDKIAKFDMRGFSFRLDGFALGHKDRRTKDFHLQTFIFERNIQATTDGGRILGYHNNQRCNRRAHLYRSQAPLRWQLAASQRPGGRTYPAVLHGERKHKNHQAVSLQRLLPPRRDELPRIGTSARPPSLDLTTCTCVVGRCCSGAACSAPGRTRSGIRGPRPMCISG